MGLPGFLLRDHLRAVFEFAVTNHESAGRALAGEVVSIKVSDFHDRNCSVKRLIDVE